MSHGEFEEFKKLLEKYFYLPQVDSLSLLPVDSALKDMVWFDDTKLRKIFDYYRSREDKKPSLDALVKTLVFRDLDTEVALLAVEYVHQAFGNHLQKSFGLAMEELRVFSEHSEQQIEKQVTKTKAPVFPSPPGLRWKDTRIAFISDNEIRVEAKGLVEQYVYDEIGFEDKRAGGKGKLWSVLRVLAMLKGSATVDDLANASKGRNNVSKDISRLRKILYDLMGIKGDPFHDHKECKCYQTRFSLRDEQMFREHRKREADSDELLQETYSEELAPKWLKN